MTQTKTAFFDGLLAMFPEAAGPMEEMQREYGEVLETVILEDVFYPAIESLLRKGSDPSAINKVFDFFEQIADSGEADLVNLLSVTILESLGAMGRF